MKRLFLSMLLGGMCFAASPFGVINDFDTTQSVYTVFGVVELAPGESVTLRPRHVFRWAGWTFKIDDDRIIPISKLDEVVQRKCFIIDLNNLIEYDLIKDS